MLIILVQRFMVGFEHPLYRGAVSLIFFLLLSYFILLVWYLFLANITLKFYFFIHFINLFFFILSPKYFINIPFSFTKFNPFF